MTINPSNSVRDVTSTGPLASSPANAHETVASRLPSSGQIDQQLAKSSASVQDPSRLKQLATGVANFFINVGRAFLGGTAGLLGVGLALPLVVLTPVGAGVGYVADKLGLIEYEMEEVAGPRGAAGKVTKQRVEGQGTGVEKGALVTLYPAVFFLMFAKDMFRK